eukprot:7391119-Prymnesium_polylepis.1
MPSTSTTAAGPQGHDTTHARTRATRGKHQHAKDTPGHTRGARTTLSKAVSVRTRSLVGRVLVGRVEAHDAVLLVPAASAAAEHDRGPGRRAPRDDQTEQRLAPLSQGARRARVVGVRREGVLGDPRRQAPLAVAALAVAPHVDVARRREAQVERGGDVRVGDPGVLHLARVVVGRLAEAGPAGWMC